MEEKTNVKKGDRNRYDKNASGNAPVLNFDRDTGLSSAMQTVERIFDFRERKLRADVNEQMMQDAASAVEQMNKDDSDYDLLVTAIGMAEREYRALEHRQENIGEATEGGLVLSFSDIDGISLAEINQRLAGEGIEDDSLRTLAEASYEFGQSETESDGKENSSDPEGKQETPDEVDSENSFGEGSPAERRKKVRKRKRNAGRKKAREKTELSRRENAEFEKQRLRELEERVRQEALRNDAELDAKASRQTAEESLRMQEAQSQRMQQTRDWEIEKHGENLVSSQEAFQTEFHSQNQRQGNQILDPGRNHEPGLAQHQNRAAQNQNGIQASSMRHDHENDLTQPQSASEHLQSDSQEKSRTHSPTQGYSQNSAPSHLPNQTQDTPASQDRENRSPRSSISQNVERSEDKPEGTAGHIHDSGSIFVPATENHHHPFVSPEFYSDSAYVSNDSDSASSYFDQQRNQQIEDDIQSREQKQTAENKNRLRQMAESAHERRESAEAFSRERHSSIYAGSEDIQKEYAPSPGEPYSRYESHPSHGEEYQNHKVSSTYTGQLNSSDNTSDFSGGPKHRTLHHYRSGNYRPPGTVIGGAEGIAETPAPATAQAYAASAPAPYTPVPSSSGISSRSQDNGYKSTDHTKKEDNPVLFSSRENFYEGRGGTHAYRKLPVDIEKLTGNIHAGSHAGSYEDIHTGFHADSLIGIQKSVQSDSYKDWKRNAHYSGDKNHKEATEYSSRSFGDKEHRGSAAENSFESRISGYGESHPAAQEGTGPGGTPSFGTVIGKGSGIPSGGNVHIINRKKHPSASHAGWEVLSSARETDVESGRGLEAELFFRRNNPIGSPKSVDSAKSVDIGASGRYTGRKEGKRNSFGRLAAGVTVGTVSAGAEDFFAGVWKKHQERSKRNRPEATGSKTVSVAEAHYASTLKPTVGMRTTAFDMASGRKVPIDKAAQLARTRISGIEGKTDIISKTGDTDKAGIIGKAGGAGAKAPADSPLLKENEQEPERTGEAVGKAGRTPSERRIGMAYARITHTRFISAVREPMGRAGKTLVGAVLGTEALRETDVGQGLYRLKRGTAYAKGAVAAAGLAGTFAFSGRLAAANAGRAFGYGANYFRGKDKIGGTAVKKGAYIIPVRRIAAVRQWEAFGKAHEDLLGEFTRTVTIQKSSVEGSTFKAIQREKKLAHQALDVTVNLAGDRTYLILDHKAMKEEIGRLLVKSGSRDFTETEALRLRDLRLMQAKGIGKISSRVNTQKIRKYKRSIENVSHMFAMYLSRSDNAGAKSIQLMVTSGKFIRAGLKVQLKAIQLGTHTKPGRFLTRQAGRAASAAARTAAQGMKGAAAGGLGLVAKGVDLGIAKAAGIDYNRFRSVKKAYIEGVKKNLQQGINGGIYNRVSASIAKASRKIGGSVAQTEAGKGLAAAGRRLGGGFAKLKKAGERISQAVGQAANAAKAVRKPIAFLFDRIFNPAAMAISFVKRVVFIGVAAFSFFLFIFVLAGTALMGSQLMFTTGADNLQKYISYAVQVSEDWFAGRLKDSKTMVGSRRMSLDEVYGKGGNEIGRYRIVTTKYVDQDGKEVDSNENIKEILSMASVKTFNTWPEDWQAVNNPFDGNNWTVKEVQDMIACLYAASHSWEAAEKGPYIYYKEVNKQRVRLLEDPEYPGTGYVYRTLKGDAQGEACRGPRAFFCTEATYPAYSSEYRREMDASYRERGGCTLDYAGYGTYDAVEDTFTLNGALHDGTNVIYNAHSAVWSTQDMKERYAVSQANGGGGDESRIRHERTYGSPAWGCADYTEGHEHEVSSTDDPPAGCTNFSLEPPQYTDIMAFPKSFPQRVTYSWNIENARYEYIHNGLIYYLSGDYVYYPYNTISFSYRPDIGYSAPSGYDIYMPEGTVFYCNDTYYDCHEIEYYCSGHREWVKIYYCPGHEEYYCDKNHYDLDIRIHISHFGSESELLNNDVENAYVYRRKARAVSEYPEGFDKNAEKPTDDFYWDKENTELAAMLAASNWEELYENIEGVDDVTEELNEDTIKKYREYLDAAHIASWVDGIPKDKNGVDVTMHGSDEWFYDESKGRYVKVRREYAELGLYTYEVIETSGTYPSQLSLLRKKIINNALAAVGKIPYEEDGAPGAGSTLADYGWDEGMEQVVRRGLSSGGFIAWVYQISGKNITNTDDIKKIWEKSAAIGDRKSITDGSLKPGDLGFINSYDDRLNEEVVQTQEDLNPFNTVAIYLGTNESGQRIWIQSSRTNGVVSVTASTACWCQIRCRIWHPTAASAGMLPATLLGSAQTPDGLRVTNYLSGTGLSGNTDPKYLHRCRMQAGDL